MIVKDKKKYENLLLKLLKFDTQNYDDKPSGYTLPLLKYIKNRLEKKGIKCKLEPYAVKFKNKGKSLKLKNRANLIAFLEKQGKPYLLLQGHVDTVPFNRSKWKYDPLGEKKGKIIFGRGAVDMKGPVTSLILAFENLTKRKNLAYSPILLLTSDEEAHSFAGIKNFLKNNRKKFLFAVSGEPTNFEIINKLYGAMYIIIKTYGLRKERYKTSVSENAIESMIQILKNIKSYKKRVLKISDRRLGNTIMNIGRIDGGLKVNQFPEECRLEFAIRNTLPCNKYLSLLKKEVLNKIKVPYEFKLVFKYDPMILKLDTELGKRLKYSLKKEGLPIKYGVQKHITEATILRSAGIPSIVFGPGDNNLFHKNDEKIAIKDLIKAEKIYTNLFN